MLASIATKELKDEQEPARWHRVIWGVILSLLAISLISVGALRVVQTSAVIVAVPVVVLYGLFTVSLVRSLKKRFS